MVRILQVVLILAILWIAWRMLRAWLSPRSGAERREKPRFEATARCVRCGTFVPREQLDAAGRCTRCIAPS